MKIIYALLLLISCDAWGRKISPTDFINLLRKQRPKMVTGYVPATFNSYTYMSNGIRSVPIGGGSNSRVVVTERTLVEIIDNRGREYHYYFSTILLEDSVIKGYESRTEHVYRVLPIKDIKRVKIRGGAIPYYYRESF